jgi:TRAP-type C4-dicarboxylate transport system permease small subunit
MTMIPVEMLARILAALDRILSLVERAASILAALALFLIMAIVASDVAMRYLFNRPWGWSYDFISLYVIVALFFLALSRTFAVNGHISVDLLHHVLSPRARRLCEIVICLLSAGFFAVMTEAGAWRALTAFEDGDVLAGAVAWPAWMSAVFVPVGAGLLTLRLSLSALCHAFTLATGCEIIPLPPVAGSAAAIERGAFE